MARRAAPSGDRSWDRLQPDEFEQLCAELLEALGFENIRRTGGPGDHGVDIRARLSVSAGGPLGQRDEEWAIQCKHTPHRALSASEIISGTGWLEHDPVTPDVYCVLTSGRISNDAQQMLDAYELKPTRPWRLQCMDGLRLKDILRDKNLDHRLSLPLDPGASRSFVDQALDVWASSAATHPEAALSEIYRRYLAEHGQEFAERFAIAYKRQHHRVVYRADGTTRTTYHLDLINLADEPVDADVMTIFGDVGVATVDMGLAAEIVGQGSGRPLQTSVAFDTDEYKILRIQFPDAVAPRDPLAYDVSVTWPFRLPIAGPRRYDMPIWRLTRWLSFEVIVPSDAAPQGPVVVDYTTDRTPEVHSVDVIPRDDGWALIGELSAPRLGTERTLVFTVP